MNNKEDNSFKMYNDEESKKLKKNMTDILTNVNSQLKQFMEKYKKNVQRLWSLIKNSGEEEKAKLEEIKKKSKMHRERQKELNKIKDFVQVNYDNLLLDRKINLNEENNNLDNIKLLKKKR